MKFAVPLLSAFLFLTNADQTPSVRVLCYHTFRDADTIYNFTLRELRDQVDFLKRNGFTFVSAGDVAAGRVKGNKNVLVTIDDGNVSVYRAYREVLKPYGIRPLLAIYPNVIGKKTYALSWEQLAELMRDGCDIAAHGYYHNLLTDKGYEKDPRSFHKEIVDSKRMLEEKLKTRVDFFVYPFGASSERAVRMVRDAGYRLAFTIRPGALGVPVSKSPHELPRYMLTRPTWRWQMHRIAGELPGEARPDAASSRLIAKGDAATGGGREAAKTEVKSGKINGGKERKGANGHIKASMAAENRNDVRKKDGPTERRRQRERDDKKQRKGTDAAEKEVALAGVVKDAATPEKTSPTGQILHAYIQPAAAATGDFLIEDTHTAQAAVTATDGGDDVIMARVFRHNGGEKENKAAPRDKLKQEYLNFTRVSFKSYGRLVDRLNDKFSGLKKSVEKLIR